MRDGLGRPQRVVLLGGTSEIGLATLQALRLPQQSEVVLAGRDEDALRDAATTLPRQLTTCVDLFDARNPQSCLAVVRRAFERGDVDVVIPAFGVLGSQQAFEADPDAAAELLTVNVTSQVLVLLQVAALMRRQGHGTLVVLSSIAAVRPRRANAVYGASKAAVDAAATGLADALTGTGVTVIVVRPGFVVGRMTAGLTPAPLSTTPEAVGHAVADAIHRGRRVVWVPAGLRALALAMRIVPRPLWRRIRR